MICHMTVELSIIVEFVCLLHELHWWCCNSVALSWLKTKKVGKSLYLSTNEGVLKKQTTNGQNRLLADVSGYHILQLSTSAKKWIKTTRSGLLPISWEKVAQCFRGYFDWQRVDFRNGFRWANWSEAEQKGAIRKTQQTTSHPAQLKKAAYILFEMERICWRQKSITFFRGTSNPRLWPTICAHLAGATTCKV